MTEGHQVAAAAVGLKNRRGQYVLWSVRAMHLPEIADIFESWLLFGCGRLEANGHDADGIQDLLIEEVSRRFWDAYRWVAHSSASCAVTRHLL